MKVNKQIRAQRVRLIDHEGKQIGVVSFHEALQMAEEVNLDLVEVVATSVPPVCKIMDHGKFKYDQTKKERENKKAQHQIKLKEVKVKPNIDVHDFETKSRQARGFIEKGNKVKITCTFRGREMAHPEVGERWVKKMCEDLADIALIEATPKMLGKMMNAVLSPNPKKIRPPVRPSKEGTAEEAKKPDMTLKSKLEEIVRPSEEE